MDEKEDRDPFDQQKGHAEGSWGLSRQSYMGQKGCNEESNWLRLSKKARRIQPVISICLSLLMVSAKLPTYLDNSGICVPHACQG